MNGQQETQAELMGRLDIIESMLREGRSTTECWGWIFVLWGTAYVIAIVWAYFGSPNLAWPVTMTAAGILTVFLASRMKRTKRQTPMGRALGGIWTGVGVSIFIFCFVVGASGHTESHSYMAAVEIFLGAANCASSIALRWRLQFFVALLWWGSAIATCFVADAAIMPILLLDTILGFLGFGLYLMVRQSRDRRRRAQHA
jgi:Flp pilus assembly protein TadB